MLGAINLPRIDELTRDEVLLGAPQPIAEALAQLDSENTPESAYRAASELTRTITQYVGAIALASRARTRTATTASDAVAALLKALQQHGLDAKGWWRLARELVRPFATIADVHPMPELVTLFFDGRAELTTAIDLILADDSPREPNREAATAELARMVPELGAALRAIRWLDEYRLVTPERAGVLLWTGIRRPERPKVELEVPPQGPALLGHENTVVLELDDVVLCRPAIPGGPSELFFLDGPGRRGARYRAMPAALEHEDSGAWARLGMASSDGPDERRDEPASPYLGLSAFSEKDAGLFFGRERELEELLNRLHTQPFVAIVGPSGAGKSSFVRAGLFPTLGADRLAVTLRPGPSPLASLATAVSAATLMSLTTDDLRTRTDSVVDALRSALAGRTAVVFVDQFEELFTLSSNTDDQEAFAVALLRIADAVDGARVVVTLRDDFLVRAAQLPSLRALASTLQILTTPAPADLARILVEPGRRSGYELEDEDLAREIVAEVANQPGALALLSFTASKLWELRDRLTKRLTRKAYRALGGVGGALAKHAESVLADMPEPHTRIVRELFRHLVTADGTRAVLSRDELVQVGGGRAADTVIEALISARLLTAMESPTGESVEVVHETLLVSWPRLVRWRAQDAENARLRDQLRSAARQWDERRRPRGMLWRSDALTEYRLWRRRYPGNLTEVEEAFGAASLADTLRGRRLRQGVAALAVSALTVALIVFARLRGAAEASRVRVQDQLIESYRDEAERALAAGDSFRALLFLEGEAHLGVDTVGHRFMVARALEAITPELATLRGHTAAIHSVAFGPDGSIATGSFDGTVRRWSGDGKLLWSVSAFPRNSDVIVAAAPASRFVAAGSVGGIDLWSLDGKLVRHLDGAPRQPVQMTFIDDGKLLLASSFDGTAHVWDVDTGTVRVLDTKVTGRAVVAVGGDRIIAVASGHDTVSLVDWDRKTPEPNARITLPGYVIVAALSRDGHTAALGELDGTIALWDLEAHRQLRVLSGHETAVTALAFRDDGSLVSASADSTIRLWDPQQGLCLNTLRGHHGAIDRGFLDRSGRFITSSDDGTAKIWDLDTGINTLTFEHGGTLVLAVSLDGTRIVTGSTLGTAKLWRADDQTSGVHVLNGAAHDESESHPWIDASGTRLVRQGARGGELWDLQQRRLLLRTGDKATLVAGDDERVYFADGASIVVADARDGSTVQRVPAPFIPSKMCIEPGTGRIVLTTTTPPQLVALDASGATLADTPTESHVRLVCEAGSVVGVGARVVFYALPNLERLGDHAVTAYPIVEPLSGDHGDGILGQSTDNDVTIWRHGNAIATLLQPAAAWRAASSPRLVVVGLSDGSLVEWDRATWTPRRRIKAHPAGIQGVAVGAGFLASFSLDSKLKIWDRDGIRPILETQVPPSTYWMQFAKNMLVLTGGDHVELRNIDTSTLTTDQLAVLVACTIPDQIRQQVGGAPPRQRDCPSRNP